MLRRIIVGCAAALLLCAGAATGSVQSLRSRVQAESRQLASARGSLAQAQARLGALDAQLSADASRLAQTQSSLRTERAHLVALELQLSQADSALTANLVSQFETDPPDAITVILESHGFADMLDRLEFVQQARRHDTEIIGADRAARRVVVAAATALGALEVRQQALTRDMQRRAADADRIRIALLNRTIAIERTRNAHAASLRAAEARERRLAASLAGLTSSPGAPAGHVLQSGGFVFPFPAGAAVPPGSWTNDQGVDIAAPGNTPELAVASGTIVLHGIGGFGPWAPVLHLDRPIDGYSYVYYGHAGPQGQLPVGTHVDAGQVMSSVGPGIVGLSSGPHVEIGFADASGAPVGPGSAPTMHALLLSAYHG
jgi:murein DD-endopeptidase MepM/ murein hydrolase activator NlpD